MFNAHNPPYNSKPIYKLPEYCIRCYTGQTTFSKWLKISQQCNCTIWHQHCQKSSLVSEHTTHRDTIAPCTHVLICIPTSHTHFLIAILTSSLAGMQILYLFQMLLEHYIIQSIVSQNKMPENNTHCCGARTGNIKPCFKTYNIVLYNSWRVPSSSAPCIWVTVQ